MERKNIWSAYTPEQIAELDNISTRYKSCLNEGKTERECVELSIRMAQEAGYRDLKDVMAKGETLKKGDRVYAVCMSKMLALFRIGEEPVSAGMNILGAHIDSPRIDVKQNPLYENEGLAYLDTHYYGGIKKYQWVAHPLALHGVVVKKDGTVTKVSIGEEEGDPVFVITDLLVHLAQEQMEKKASKVIDGEKLDLLIGNRPAEKVLEELQSTEKTEEKERPEEKSGQPAEPENKGGEDYEYTFDTFIVGSSNKFAHAASMAVATKPAVLYNPLFIYGNSGLGKTHLLYAIENEIQKRHPEMNIIYIKGEEFTNQIVDAIKNDTTNEFHNKYRSADVLLVDDIQFIAGKEAECDEYRTRVSSWERDKYMINY